jgi:hypothetical protein
MDGSGGPDRSDGMSCSMAGQESCAIDTVPLYSSSSRWLIRYDSVCAASSAVLLGGTIQIFSGYVISLPSFTRKSLASMQNASGGSSIAGTMKGTTEGSSSCGSPKTILKFSATFVSFVSRFSRPEASSENSDRIAEHDLSSSRADEAGWVGYASDEWKSC